MKGFLGLLLFFVLLSILGCGDDNLVSNNGNPSNNNGNPSNNMGNQYFNYIFYTTVGGDGWEWGRDILSVPAGGYIVAGWTDSYGQGRNDLYLIRVDAQGNVVWDNNFGGNEDDYSDGVTLTADGNILAVGGSNSFGTEYEKYVVKVDMDGNLIWENTMSTATYERPFKVIAVSDGYIIGGNTGDAVTDEKFSVMKIDLDGNLVWDSTYTSTSTSRFYDMVATDDGGFVLVGAYILKISSDGVTQWTNNTSDISSVLETTDGSIVIAGDNYISKLGSDGSLIWEYNYSGESNMNGGYVVENNDGTLSVCNQNGSTAQICITKFDAEGNLISSYETGITGIPFDMIQGQTGYVITGFFGDENEESVFVAEIEER